jgi:integrative and conjugative element protein (TIGR02256 family)
MKAIISERINGGRFKMSDEIVALMQTFVQDSSWKAEAGGILIGRHILDTLDIVVDSITVPMPGDCRGRYWFYRHRRGHQQVMDTAWRKSCGTCTYLGEWHTHPQPIPTPSFIDVHGWIRKLNLGTFVGESVFFVIVGLQALGVWEGDKRGRRIYHIGEFNLIRKDIHGASG